MSKQICDLMMGAYGVRYQVHAQLSPPPLEVAPRETINPDPPGESKALHRWWTRREAHVPFHTNHPESGRL